MHSVLVTGGVGLVDSKLVIDLIGNETFKVVNVDALTYASDDRLPDVCNGSPRYDVLRADINDRERNREIVILRRPLTDNGAAKRHGLG